jgi:hypothetical protein
MSDWVSTSAAAAALGVSERTVLRRAAAGKLESRRETTPRGVVVVVALDSADVPTGADGADTNLTTHLAEENRFLRGVIEQLQRDGAETRAALREALKAPRQLTSGPTQSVPEVPTASAQRADEGLDGAAGNEAENGAVSSYGALADWLENQMDGR